jgi:excisionase family DNA binding protein
MNVLDDGSGNGFSPRIGRSVSIDHAAELLKVSRRTIYNRIRDGRLQTIRTLGGSQRVLLESLGEIDRRWPRFEDRPVPRTTIVSAVLVAAVLVGGFARPALAQHRARLSADLADRLAAGAQDIDVIVQGTGADIDTLATRYNLVIRRRMQSGAVLHVNAGQLDALQRDEAVDHLSGDVRVQSLDEVTAETIGADQVWAGAAGAPSLSGAGVGVAVIDSGIDTTHVALRNRVVATVDFTGGDGKDHYGHGTHVASGFSISRWARPCSSPITTIRCARRPSGRRGRGCWSWRQPGTSGRRRTARPCSAASRRRGMIRTC